MSTQLGTTFLEVINQGRNYLGGDDLTFEDVSLNKSVASDALAAANKAWQQMLSYSSDLQFGFKISDVKILADTEELRIEDLQETDPIDLDLIKWIKVKKDDLSGYHNLVLIEDEDEWNIKGNDVATGYPVFFSLNEGKINILPKADKEYTCKIAYQKEFKKISETNIADPVPFSKKWELVLEMGIEAYLKARFTRPDAEKCEQNFFSKLKSTARYLNKHTKKKKFSRYTYGSRRTKRAF